LMYSCAPSMELLTLVPKFILGGLIFCMGLDITLDACVASRNRVAKEEWRVIVLGSVMSYVNMLYGIGLGLAVSFILFIVEYAHVSGVIRDASLVEVRSHVDRGDTDLAKLSVEGNRCRVYWLTGYFFFGTAMSVCLDIQEQLVKSSLKVLILDFDTVPAVDASGVSALVNLVIKARRLGCQVCFSSVVRRLRAAVENNLAHKGAEPMKFTGTVAQALAWAEEKILKLVPDATAAHAIEDHHSVLLCPAPQPFNISLTPALGPAEEELPELENEHTAPKRAGLLWFVQILGEPLSQEEKVMQTLSKSTQVLRIKPGATVFTAQKPSEFLLILVEGEVLQSQRVSRSKPFVKLNATHLNAAKHDQFAFDEATKITRARRVRAPTILNLVEFAAGPQALLTTSAKAEGTEQVVVVAVPVAAMQELAHRDTQFGAVMHRWSSTTLASLVMGLMQQEKVDPFREVVGESENGGHHHKH